MLRISPPLLYRKAAGWYELLGMEQGTADREKGSCLPLRRSEAAEQKAGRR